MPELPEDDSVQTTKEINRSPHCFNLFLTLLFIFAIYLRQLCQLTRPDPPNFNDILCSEYKDFFSCLLFIIYLVYFVECAASGLGQILEKSMEISEYEAYLAQIKAEAPLIGTRIECYHHETRTRTNRNGSLTAQTETYLEKVITFKGTSYFNYRSWEDVTGEVIGVNRRDIVKLELAKAYDFGDYESARRFERHRAEYIEENRTRDDNIDSFPIFEVPGFKEKVLVLTSSKPYCLSYGWFLLWSLFLLSWPYRIWFEFATKTKSITLRKVINA